MLAAGCILQGRYQIEEVLGQGGMGAVYLATEKHLGGKKVAIKEMAVLIENPADKERALEQFHAEARILATLDHPGLVDVTHYFDENGKQYLVMAYVSGKTFEQLLNATPYFLPEAEVLDWFEQVADVLIYLHRHKPPIIFRDMKPSNVMVDDSGRVRLIDFGIARSFDHGSKTSTFIKGAGTAGFAPLEQYGHEGTTDPRTDVYALGATLYTMMTRTIPRASVDLASSDEALTPPRSINPSISPRLEAVILTMMALKKNDRYQTMEAARQALRLVRTALATASEASPAVTMRFCTNCGAPATVHTQWCNRCGTSLDSPRGASPAAPFNTRSESTAVKASSPISNLQPDVPVESIPTLYRDAPANDNTAPIGAAPAAVTPPPPEPPPPDTPVPAPPVSAPPTRPARRRTGRWILLTVGLLCGGLLVLLGLKPDLFKGVVPDGAPSASTSPTVPVVASSSSAPASPSSVPLPSAVLEVSASISPTQSTFPVTATSASAVPEASSPSPSPVTPTSASASPLPSAALHGLHWRPSWLSRSPKPSESPNADPSPEASYHQGGKLSVPDLGGGPAGGNRSSLPDGSPAAVGSSSSPAAESGSPAPSPSSP